jgi:hypothetical protein
LSQSSSGSGGNGSVPKKEREIHGVDFRVVNTLFLDSINSSPVHLAVLAGKEEILAIILDELGTEDRKEAVTRPGIDDMSPFHLVTHGGNLRCVDRIIVESENATGYWEDDLWDRGTLHIAGSYGYDKIAVRLLERPRSFPENEGYDGRTALDLPPERG